MEDPEASTGVLVKEKGLREAKIIKHDKLKRRLVVDF